MNKKLKLGVAAVATTAVLASGVAFAASQNFLANIRFATPLTLTKNADLDFGTVQSLTPGTYVLSTAGVVTASNGGITIGGTPVAGNLLIQGSDTQNINISTSALTADQGVTPSNPTCAYDGGAEVACNTLTNQAAPTAAGKTLLIGLQLDADGTQADGLLATPNFNVDVVYN